MLSNQSQGLVVLNEWRAAGGAKVSPPHTQAAQASVSHDRYIPAVVFANVRATAQAATVLVFPVLANPWGVGTINAFVLLSAVLTVARRVAFTAIFPRFLAVRAATHIPLLTHVPFTTAVLLRLCWCRRLHLMSVLLLLLLMQLQRLQLLLKRRKPIAQSLQMPERLQGSHSTQPDPP